MIGIVLFFKIISFHLPLSLDILLNPVIPISTDKVLNSIGIDQNNRTLEVAKNHKDIER